MQLTVTEYERSLQMSGQTRVHNKRSFVHLQWQQHFMLGRTHHLHLLFQTASTASDTAERKAIGPGGVDQCARRSERTCQIL